MTGASVVMLFQIGSIISHDCTPNTKHTFSSDDYSVNFFATVKIRESSTSSEMPKNGVI